jgi:2-C-methyl-D-erythritol 4-phosphate cytidylyltransferase / 2-C-methyl-D-erythritol 2,4-cyclodiphosphate synthase
MTGDGTGSIAALIVAAGQGVRAGGGVPKQYRPMGGKAILRRAMDAFLDHPLVSSVTTIIGPLDAAHYASIAPQHQRLEPPLTGGPTRQDSVRIGLERLADAAPARVLIHDGVRPFPSAALIERVITALDRADAVVPALPVTATLKAVNDDGLVRATLPRAGVEAAETPQGFRFDAILAAHRKAKAEGQGFTDDASIAEWAGIRTMVVAGDPANIKLTTVEDIEAASRLVMTDAAIAQGDVRVGLGYDVHAYGPGYEVMLGGVAIPHSRGTVGHSDGDVALHALTDAILGALAEGDIGDHFPPSDPQWKGASSDRFIRFAADRVRARGGAISHLDVAIVAEAPKVAEHRAAIRRTIAGIVGITEDRVAVKATTSENLGFIGRNEGIAAMATATVRLPFSR